MKRRILVLLLASVLLIGGLLSGCGGSKEDEKAIVGSIFGCWHNNTYYYRSMPWPNRILYQRIDNVQETGLPLYDDLLVEDVEDPFQNVSYISCVLVDPQATRANGGDAMLILPMQMREFTGDLQDPYIEYNRICYYNVRTHRITVIKDEMPNSVGQMILCGDTLYYTTSDGDLGWNVHKVKTDGTEEATMVNPNANLYVLTDVADGVVYLYEDSAKTVYTCSTELENPRLLIDEPVAGLYSMRVIDGYLYYHVYSKIVDGQATCYEIRRIPVSGTQESELVMADVAFGYFSDGCYYYFPYHGQQTLSDFRKLYEYDLETGETRLIFDNGSQAIFRCYTDVSDRYLTCYVHDLATGKNYAYMSCIDLETLEEVKVPY